MKNIYRFLIALLILVGPALYFTSLQAGGTKVAYNQLPVTIPQYAKITLSAAQMKALVATPIQLVAAPGAGFMVIPVYVQFNYHGAGHTGYVVPNDNLYFKWGTNSDISGITGIAQSMFVNTTDEFAYTNSIGDQRAQSPVEVSDADNQPLMFTHGGGVEYTVGTGTLDVIVYYHIVPTS